MSKFMQLDAKAPATLGAVVEAVTRLSTLGEAKILELVSAGKIADWFPFKHGREHVGKAALLQVNQNESGRSRVGVRSWLQLRACHR